MLNMGWTVAYGKVNWQGECLFVTVIAHVSVQ